MPLDGSIDDVGWGRHGGILRLDQYVSVLGLSEKGPVMTEMRRSLFERRGVVVMKKMSEDGTLLTATSHETQTLQGNGRRSSYHS